MPGARAGSPSPSEARCPPHLREDTAPTPAHVARTASRASTPHSAHNWRAPGPSALTGRFSAGSPTRYPVEISWGFWKALSSHSAWALESLDTSAARRPPPSPLHYQASAECQSGGLAVGATQKWTEGTILQTVSNPRPHPVESRARYFLDWCDWRVTGTSREARPRPLWRPPQQVYSQPDWGSRREPTPNISSI